MMCRSMWHVVLEAVSSQHQVEINNNVKGTTYLDDVAPTKLDDNHHSYIAGGAKSRNRQQVGFSI